MHAGVGRIEHQGGRGGVGEAELGGLALDLVGDVQQIAGVEADLEGLGVVVDLDLFRRRTGIGMEASSRTRKRWREKPTKSRSVVGG